jgi:hypothetical protein
MRRARSAATLRARRNALAIHLRPTNQRSAARSVSLFAVEPEKLVDFFAAKAIQLKVRDEVVKDPREFTLDHELISEKN